MLEGGGQEAAKAGTSRHSKHPFSYFYLACLSAGTAATPGTPTTTFNNTSTLELQAGWVRQAALCDKLVRASCEK